MQIHLVLYKVLLKTLLVEIQITIIYPQTPGAYVLYINEGVLECVLKVEKIAEAERQERKDLSTEAYHLNSKAIIFVRSS